jgi:hypothetical protein
MQRILDRLKKENLKGPLNESWVLVSNSKDSELDDEDMDSLDPRWLSLFMDYFIIDSHADSDDLLFFVLDKEEVSGIPMTFNCPVKRRVDSVDNSLPSGVDAESVQWKTT